MTSQTHCPICGHSLGDPNWCLSCGEINDYKEAGSLASLPYEPKYSWANPKKNFHLAGVEYLIERLGFK